MRTIKGLLIIALLAFSSAFFIESTNVFLVEKVEAACPPGQFVANGQNCAGNSAKPIGHVKNHLVYDIIEYYNPIAGTLAGMSILAIIYSAYTLITSAGMPQKVFLAKKLLFGAGIGLIIILSSFTIMRLLLGLAQTS